MANGITYNAKKPVPCDSCNEKNSCHRHCYLFKRYLNGETIPLRLLKNPQNREMPVKVGDIYGKWTIIAATDKKVGKKSLRSWVCQCSCKYATKRYVSDRDLRLGRSKSCGKCHPWRKWESQDGISEQL